MNVCPTTPIRWRRRRRGTAFRSTALPEASLDLGESYVALDEVVSEGHGRADSEANSDVLTGLKTASQGSGASPLFMRGCCFGENGKVGPSQASEARSKL